MAVPRNKLVDPCDWKQYTRWNDYPKDSHRSHVLVLIEEMIESPTYYHAHLKYELTQEGTTESASNIFIVAIIRLFLKSMRVMVVVCICQT